MANPRKRVPENVAGDFFVDSTCIGCDACRQIAPSVFGEAAETSFVKAQPVLSNFAAVQKEIAALPSDTVVSTRLNQYFRKVVFLEILSHIRNALETAG